MFKYKHVTIKFRPPIIRGENLTIIDTNLKSKKLALALAHGMIHKYPGVSLLSLLMVLKYEQMNIITGKAFSMLPKFTRF